MIFLSILFYSTENGVLLSNTLLYGVLYSTLFSVLSYFYIYSISTPYQWFYYGPESN